LAHAGSEEIDNQVLRAHLAWSINSGKIESNPRDFQVYRCYWHVWCIIWKLLLKRF